LLARHQQKTFHSAKEATGETFKKRILVIRKHRMGCCKKATKNSDMQKAYRRLNWMIRYERVSGIGA
jgi:hypothetical protein